MLAEFKNGTHPVMIATDVAARGLGVRSMGCSGVIAGVAWVANAAGCCRLLLLLPASRTALGSSEAQADVRGAAGSCQCVRRRMVLHSCCCAVAGRCLEAACRSFQVPLQVWGAPHTCLHPQPRNRNVQHPRCACTRCQMLASLLLYPLLSTCCCLIPRSRRYPTPAWPTDGGGWFAAVGAGTEAGVSGSAPRQAPLASGSLLPYRRSLSLRRR